MAAIVILEGKPADVCALGTDADVCLDPTHYEQIEKSLSGVRGGEPKTAAKNAAKSAAKKVFEKLDCDDDVCVLNHPETKKALGEQEVAKLEKERLKPQGPADSTQLLDNFNIDSSLWQWGKAHSDFQPVAFAMIDFATHPMPIMGDYPGMVRLRDYDPVQAYKHGKTCAGCVINSDKSTGGGIHWMALFVDCRSAPWTVEFFNSTGRPPVSEIVRWQLATKERLAPLAAQNDTTVEDLSVTQVEHQNSNTECGPYSLYYIWSRISGEPHDAFRKHRISDENMLKFRKMLFRVKT